MRRKLLSEKDFRTILEKYNVGSFKSRRFIDITITNLNYKLVTTKGTFLLKRFDNPNSEDLIFQNNLVSYLRNKKVRVPKVVFTKNESSVAEFGGKYVSIYEFVEGAHLKKLTPAVCKDLAKQVAKMHKALLEYKPKRAVNRPNYSVRELNLMQDKRLRKIYVHGDLGKLNILTSNNKVTAIIDFGDAKWDLLAKDLGVLNILFIGKSRIKFLPIFYSEYQKHLSLNKQEKQVIPMLTKIYLQNAMKWLKRELKKAQTRSHQRHIEKAIIAYGRKLKSVDSFPINIR